MSFRYAAVAVRASKEDLLDAVLEIWDHWTSIAGPVGCANEAELLAWTTPRCAFIRPGPAREPNDVKGVVQDGAWAVLVDWSQRMIADERNLHRLSLRFGVVAVGLAEGTSTTAMFEYYEGGQRFRRIQAVKGRIVTEGAALPEEEGFDASARFRLDELQRLWRALGMSNFRLSAAGPFLAVHVIDTEAALAPRPESVDKPWWRFW